MYGYGHAIPNIVPQSGGIPLLLDLFPGDLGLSFRLVRQAYSGALVRIRRSSDNAEKDFFPDANNILSLTSEDGAGLSLTDWITTDDGFVPKWYDQSGNTNDAVQTTALDQPKIVAAGVVILKDGDPAMLFDGTDFLVTGSRLITSGTFATFMVFATNDIAGSITQAVFGQHPGAATVGRINFMQLRNSDDSFILFFNNGTSRLGIHTTTVTTSRFLVSALGDDSDYDLAIDGANEQVITSQSLTPLNIGCGVGAQNNGSNFFKGHIQEIIGYDSDESSNQSAIETDINNFYSIF